MENLFIDDMTEFNKLMETPLLSDKVKLRTMISKLEEYEQGIQMYNSNEAKQLKTRIRLKKIILQRQLKPKRRGRD
jgi:hypothetical protein